MKLTYLGTAAAEGWPALFCNCKNCREATRLGGRNIRTRSQTLINTDLLIDLPPDTYYHKLMSGIDFSAVKYLFVTHWHMDHFYPQELTVRGSIYSHRMTSPELDIYCAAGAKAMFDHVSWEADKETIDTLHFHILKPFEPVHPGDYTVTPLPANHMHELKDGQPFIYLIEHQGQRLLYAHDTGIFYPEVWDFLEKSGHIDLVSLDGTCGTHQVGPNGGHMGLPDNREVRARLIESGICDDTTRFILNHFSHNGGLLFDEMSRRAGSDFTVSYDGMEIVI